MPGDSIPYPQPGEVIAGKYRVEWAIGAGGMGMVVAAHHLQLRTRVALKFMRPTAGLDSMAIARFLREARAAASIKSEHVARVSDIGTLENGTPYLVMEYLEGRDLDRELEERGRLPIAEAVDILLQACEALAEAHALGIVHRDLKPANLFLCRRGAGAPSLKLLDFGISKLMGSLDEPSVTQSHTLLGSPLYMSPEQLRSPRDVDARSDVWALGAVLYQLVTGEPPFPGELLSDICVKIATEPHRPLAALLGDVPSRLKAVVDRCLEKDRRRRYPNVAELALDLAELATKTETTAVERLVSSIKAYPAPVKSAPDLQETVARPRSDARTATGNSEFAELRARERPGRSRRSVVVVVAGVALAAGAWSFVRAERLGTTGAVHEARTDSSASAAASVASVAPGASAAPPAIRPSPDRTESTRSGTEPALSAAAPLPVPLAATPHRPAGAAVKRGPSASGRESSRPATAAPAPAAPRNVFDTRKL